MIKKNLYILLFFVMSTVASYVVAMEAEHNLGFFIENPFDKKQEDEISLTLDVSVVQENDFFAENGEKRDCVFDKGQNDLAFVSHLSGIAYSPKRQLAKSRKKTKKRYADIFEKNEEDEFECPYNCPDRYTHKIGKNVVQHIKRRHNPEFDLQTFDREETDLNMWIPRKPSANKKKKYVDVFEKNEKDEFECLYNCPEEYTHEKGSWVVQHIKARHDPEFDLQTFDLDEADLDVWIPRKKKYGNKIYKDVFDQNDKKEFVCPYNCLGKYACKDGRDVVRHIKRRHDKDFDLQTFDPTKADLDAWILRKKNSGGKKKYADVLEKNERGEFECLYNCPDEYAHKKGSMVAVHIKARHNKNFDLQTFDPDKANLAAWIPRKQGGRKKRYAGVFEKNGKDEFECPYNCSNEYTHKNGKMVVLHIKARHNPEFDLQTFDPDEADLDAWIPRKKAGRKRNPSIRSGELLRMLGKRKRENHDKKGRLKKKRKLRI